MADLITIDQFTARLPRALTAAETTLATALIVDASALAVDIVNDATVTDTWDAASAGTVPSSVVPVVVAMVRRGMDNPHGFTAETQTDYSYSGASGVGVFATGPEARVLRKAADKSPVGALNLDSYLPVSPYDPGVAWLDGAL